ncbi:glycosyltransferase family 2 protein [Pontibacter beigongshangensis]|uniref:glycosyltransferase family 2 protein n=1 Tax=Pontibacter beigongshangensis TaxID=2574733 RepID=UPI00164F5665|nr:glycosyltransferase family 2 protein [Pontibacter beigongshangensis]
MKKVAVVIINFNSSDFTINCVRSILEKTPADFDYGIVVIDNNSQIADYTRMQQSLQAISQVTIFRSRINVGFSAGNMLGVQLVQAEYYFFLNNDCEFLNDNISLLYNFMQQNTDVGVACGQMYNTNHSPHHSFGYLPTLGLMLFGTSFMRIFGSGVLPSKTTAYSRPLKVPFVTGASMFVDFQKLSEVGGLDTNYFLYCEEEDIAKKMKDKGYFCYLLPAAQFIHHMGKSTSRNFDIEKEFYISRLYYHRKHNNMLAYQAFKLLHFFRNFRKFYKDAIYARLAFFILIGAPLRYSLRHRQQISPL